MEVSETKRNEIAEQYYYLVIKSAKKLGSKYKIDSDDLTGAGSEALLLAAEDVDSSRSKQATEHFIRRWVENYMMNAIRAMKPLVSINMGPNGETLEVIDPDGCKEIEYFENYDSLKRQICDLPETYQPVFLTKLANPDATSADIAKALRITVRRVNDILLLGRKLLRA